jgi:S-formylglutathione hydrolase FrmB
MRSSLKIALVLLLVWPAIACAQSRVECNALPSAILQHSVRYCVLLPPGYNARTTRPYPVLYFLHGLGENEQLLVTSGAWNMAERLRETGKIGDMLIAAPAAGSSFYINSRDGLVRYEDFFVREFMPAIERKYRAGGARSGRAVAGVSMGGYGALRFAFKYPQMFSGVAVQMPALYDKLPPALATAVAAGGTRRPGTGSAFGSPPDERFWQQNSPLTLARSNTVQLRRLKIYFDCGDHDDYGFNEGAEALHRILAEKRIVHEFHVYPGQHDWIYVAAHFESVLQFVWVSLSTVKH